MSYPTLYCQVCLRTDRKLRVIDNRLSEFHDELCDFYINMLDPEYCMECEHLLRKLYNFKVKCLLSVKIMKKQKKAKPGEKPLPTHLYTLLPPTSLGICNRTYYYEITERTATSNIQSSLRPHIFTVPITTIVESQTEDNHIQEHLKNGRDEEIKKIEFDNAVEEQLHDLKTEDAAVFEEVLVENDDSIRKGEEFAALDDSINSDDEVQIITKSSELNDHCYNKVENKSVKRPLADLVNVSLDGDYDHDYEVDFVDVDDSESEETIKSKKAKRKGSTKVKVSKIEPKMSLDDDDDHDVVFEVDFDDEDDSESEEIIKSKKAKKKGSTKGKVPKIEPKMSLDDDDDDLDVVFEVDFDDEDDSESEEKIISKKGKKKDSTKGKVSKIKPKMSLDDDYDHDIDDVDDVDDSESEEKVKGKKGKKKDSTKGKVPKIEPEKERSGTKREIDELRDHIRKIHDGCQRKRVKKEPVFNKERLISELKSKFASCGELKTASGDIIDKQFILSVMDDKVSEQFMKHIWKHIFDDTWSPSVIRTFSCIQNKYKCEYETIFDIDYLNTEEKVLAEFAKRKSYDSYVNAKFKCEICYLTFTYLKKWEVHMKSHGDSGGSFICTVCNLRFTKKQNLTAHRVTHEAVFKCRLCPLITYHRGSMIHHYYLHKGKKYKCETCGAVLGSYSAYHTHRSYRHSQTNVCTTCARAFFTEIGLKWHRTREHDGEETIIDPATSVRCDACDIAFPSDEVYKKHVSITHEKQPPKDRRTYRRLTKGVIQRKPSQTCRVCNIVGPSMGWLSLHFRTEHPDVNMALLYADKKTNLCHICGKGYSSIYFLRDHLLKHSGERPFQCSTCPKRFHTSAQRNLHQLLHLPPGETCTHCGKKFHSRSGLYNHMSFHIGNRRYKCKICDKGFLHSSTLNEHVRGVHNNVRRVRKRVTETPGGRARHDQDSD